LLFITILTIVLAACERTKTVCPSESETPSSVLQLSELIQTTSPPSPARPIEVEIQGKKMQVDKVVDYPLCNDEWSGTVYVSCEVQVAEAELDANANPLFLKGCNLKIAPNTVVYVAAHNDAAYYKGCSCHSGGIPEP
jgi:hypothetical protein